MKKRIILWIALLPGVAAQAQTLHRTECPLGYDQYIGRVWRENLSYAAEKLNVRIADAEVKAAGVFNDPQFGVEYGNNADRLLARQARRADRPGPQRTGTERGVAGRLFP